MIPIAHCRDCCKQLEAWGAPARCVYQMLCKNFVLTSSPVLIELDALAILQVIRFLELNGWLVSCEHTDGLLVKPAHITEVDGRLYFCKHVPLEEL